MPKDNDRLGRGLEALFADASEPSGDVNEIPVSEIQPNRSQPRKKFDEASMAELTDSISQHGVLQPILLRPLPSGGYEIIAGERRFRAAMAAGLKTIPAVVKSMTDRESAEAALIENLQREDLNPVEEARGIKKLIDDYGCSQEEAASKLGTSRPSVTNSLRILSLPDDVLTLIEDGKLSAGHAKALLSIKDPELISAAAKDIAEKGLSVREAEKLCASLSKKPRTQAPKATAPEAAEVELALKNSLGVEVAVKYRHGKGSLTLNFYSKEQLYDFANRLSNNNQR